MAVVVLRPPRGLRLEDDFALPAAPVSRLAAVGSEALRNFGDVDTVMDLLREAREQAQREICDERDRLALSSRHPLARVPSASLCAVHESWGLLPDAHVP